MKTMITVEVTKASMTGILRRCLPVMFWAALAATANAQTEEVIFNFSFDTTGWQPGGNGYTLVEPNGDVIGTAQFGGDTFKGNGVVFKASPPTKKYNYWRYGVIHRFNGPQENPSNGVTAGGNGILFGMTAGDGIYDCGVVYQLTPPALSATGKWTETEIHAFQPSSSDGCNPSNAQLLYDVNTGSLYGTTSEGGASSSGTLFRLDPPAEAGGAWTETILYAFTGGSDGANPSGGLAGDPDGGIIYGTTQRGGKAVSGEAAGGGLVWGYNTATGAISAIYTFAGGSDGALPQGGVIGPFPYSVQANNYYLLGTTASGGSGGCTYVDGQDEVPGCGTVFAINLTLTSQGQTITETQLHAFSGTDGAFPVSGLLRAGGGAWGTTGVGGPAYSEFFNGYGTLFEIQINSHISYTTLTFASVYNFLGAPGDGAIPATGLGADGDGNLYGMTLEGGENENACCTGGAGTIFKFVP